MQYNGIELKEITEKQIFNQPKKMLVWNNTMDYAVSSMIVAIVERMDGLCAICYDGESYPHCADIPEEPKPRRATNRELAKWLAQGNGQMLNVRDGLMPISSSWAYFGDDDSFIKLDYRVRKWEDTEWHEPTADSLGIE